jgi:hypothetical protein
VGQLTKTGNQEKFVEPCDVAVGWTAAGHPFGGMSYELKRPRSDLLGIQGKSKLACSVLGYPAKNHTSDERNVGVFMLIQRASAVTPGGLS